MKLNETFLVLALVAEIIGTIGGFGSSVFFVPLGNFYFDFYSVLGLTALFHLSSNLSKIFLFKKGLNKFLLVYIGIPSVVFVILGGFLSKWIQTQYLELTLGVFLIGLSLLFLIKKNLVIKPQKKQSIIGGTLSGFAAGLLGTGGAIRGLTMAAFNLEKNVFIATSAFIDFMIDFSRTFVYYRNGYIHEHDLKYVPFLLVIGIVGTYLGKKILNWIPQEKFKILSLILILAIGVFTLLKLGIQK
ncbi:MAG TPA: sulfite exporter TauE/SafE family protein [Flavobacteriaceae bacterium]|nr:sulfite exporter TauE/SafE family protein [Flavobacteriaceae bacterium]MCB9214167.1 sulfite exporter TauE/SafE family protein [Alteromonas sp.]HPF12553.1 sulfite exporter TauE/SafE family protein [Flavobacteriaceae bacterium]HQU22455.1 sulfite exporter TauE/SafE family protein [Flavobacteriaceae bacterium]HQU66424.1 sulfite exporter TauE/SafE family protein [Flavobacteriaceae bacterium]